jgi:hypothetical protein
MSPAARGPICPLLRGRVKRLWIVSEPKDQAETELSFCRRCGGDRHHTVIAKKERHWSDNEAQIDGSDTWSILECRGCQNITFVHIHWFSEDLTIGDEGPEPIVHRDLYPPSPPRPLPEWASELWLALKHEDRWVVKLHSDIYTALGSGALSLAAMGTRAIVDFVVTSKVGDAGVFTKKLERMHNKVLITDVQAEIIRAAFDAGSAAAHRGYIPTQEDVYTLLDITETLLRQIYIDPMRQKRQAEAAAALKTNTPQRLKSKHS